MPNYSIALSGLSAANDELDVISNNLANMSTTAYKAKSTSFSDSFYESLGSSGSGDSISVGSGVTVSATSTDYTSGSYSSTSSSTDMAISGDGFFVVEDSSGNQYLTRDGEFTEDTSGHLETSSGDYLMGYEATDGTISSTTLSEIVLPTTGSTISGTASTEFTVTANLNSSASVGDSYTSSVTFYDSLGESHTATITYTKTDSNDWDYTVTMDDADFSATSSSTGTTTIASGTMTFDSTGNLETIDGATVSSSDTSEVSLSVSGLSSGASDLTLQWELLSSSGDAVMTQTSADSSSSSDSNGYTAGTYKSFSVSSDGTVDAVYSNGESITVGQIVVATVTNEQGLSSVGSNLYEVTSASGSASITTAGSGSAGTILNSELEESNVDISTEFANLIIAQRAFQANAKAITTFDSVTQSAIQMVSD